MSLSPGTKLGPYEIRAPLGAGGMGELVEGEALAAPLPLETALPYTRQIADAMEAAHEKGIVHRLKPANVKVTPPGVDASRGCPFR